MCKLGDARELCLSYAGSNRFRFEGSDLRPLTATPRLLNPGEFITPAFPPAHRDAVPLPTVTPTPSPPSRLPPSSPP